MPGAVLDYGMGLKATKYSVRKKRAPRFVGYSSNPELVRKRANSFDATHRSVESIRRKAFDTVVLEAPHASEEAVRTAWPCLVEGGTLLLRCNAQRLIGGDAPERWFRQRDFHLIYRDLQNDGSTIVAARKRTRRLRDIAREVCASLSVPGVDAEAVAKLLAPEW